MPLTYKTYDENAASQEQQRQRAGQSNPGAAANLRGEHAVRPERTSEHPEYQGQDQQQRPPVLSKEEADRLYEERIEEEYAKREGGA
ncbi:hypothetical protein KEM55_000687 [Ascosphaera atra]|nr:hypothetical protein KEM55_000687 [Ascosphaera atra]